MIFTPESHDFLCVSADMYCVWQYQLCLVLENSQVVIHKNPADQMGRQLHVVYHINFVVFSFPENSQVDIHKNVVFEMVKLLSSVECFHCRKKVFYFVYHVTNLLVS